MTNYTYRYEIRHDKCGKVSAYLKSVSVPMNEYGNAIPAVGRWTDYLVKQWGKLRCLACFRTILDAYTVTRRVSGAAA